MGYILVVDDEPRYLRLIRFILESAGYRVACVETGEAVMESLLASVPELLILDVMLPGMDGFQVCRQVREASTVPIIMLTARGDEDARVKGLQEGADDYVAKPFSARELVARVGAVLRRARPGQAPQQGSSYTCGDLQINFLSRRVTFRGQEVRLSPTQYRLLNVLAASSGSVVPHDDLLERVWGANYRGDHEMLRICMWRLRQRLEPQPRSPRLIVTVPGVGYVLGSSVPVGQAVAPTSPSTESL